MGDDGGILLAALAASRASRRASVSSEGSVRPRRFMLRVDFFVERGGGRTQNNPAGATQFSAARTHPATWLSNPALPNVEPHTFEYCTVVTDSSAPSLAHSNRPRARFACIALLRRRRKRDSVKAKYSEGCCRGCILYSCCIAVYCIAAV